MTSKVQFAWPKRSVVGLVREEAETRLMRGLLEISGAGVSPLVVPSSRDDRSANVSYCEQLKIRIKREFT
jgi:hypothetical protein